MKLLSLVFFYAFCLSFCLTSAAQTAANGEAKVNENNTLTIWSDQSQSWLTVEKFWLEYANSKDSRFWGKSKDYPEYQKVNEFDTLLIELAKGSCLMEFFHGRWRLANDVRRWNDKLNEYAGCPTVFD